ncbi:MAG TPA: helix-turn-helix domain-containing protein [Bauldia sp.]|nr:helix-turn-helix domain-containing protein [Bauldia sp.]
MAKPGNTPDPASFDKADCHAVQSILSRVGDKWTVLVVTMLSSGPHRFNALRTAIDGISQRMLTLTLRSLERDGLVSRTVFPTVPPKVEYALTDLGRTLVEPMVNLAGWAVRNRRAIEERRRRFDRRAASGAAISAGPVTPAA